MGRSLVLAQGADRVGVTGEGTLNGNSKTKNDFYGRGRENGHRPTILWFDECTNVTVQGVTMTSAGFWTSSYTLCRNLRIDGIRITDSTFMNNDGCDICDCENVVIEHCDIDCLDDAVCLKGFMPGGCKNIVVRNNRLRSLCNAIKTGTDSSGGFQNLLIENNKVYQTGIAGIALEITDGGTMQNVDIRNTVMDVVGTPIFIKLGNRNRPMYDGEKKFAVPRRRAPRRAHQQRHRGRRSDRAPQRRRTTPAQLRLLRLVDHRLSRAASSRTSPSRTSISRSAADRPGPRRPAIRREVPEVSKATPRTGCSAFCPPTGSSSAMRRGST